MYRFHYGNSKDIMRRRRTTRDEKGVDYFRSRNPGKVERQLVKRLEQLGYQITAPPAA